MRLKRFWPGASVGVLGLVLVAVALAAPASGATSKSTNPRTKIFTLGRSAAAQPADQDGGGGDDGDSAEEMQARADFEAAIASAPAQAIPAGGLQAAIASANSLPATGGTWNELTARPFLNDPVNRGDNFGVGWDFVSGRMTAFTSSGSTLYAGSASGGVWRTTDWATTGRPSATACRGCRSARSPPTRPTDRSGSAPARPTTLPRTSTASAPIGSPAARRPGHGSAAASWMVPAPTGSAGSTATSTPPPATGSTGAPRRRPTRRHWQVVLKPDPNPFNSPYRTSFITDVIAVPGSGGRKIMAVDGWAGYADARGDPLQRVLRGHRRGRQLPPRQAARRHQREQIGRTSLSTSGGWLYAVVQDTSTDSLVGEGAFVSKSGNPAGPWKTIATSDKLANSDSALDPPNADLTSYFPGVQADYNQYILADPNNRRHVYLGLEEVYETTNVGAHWNTVGPYWNYDISCDAADDTPYNCPMTTHPDQHAGYVFPGQLFEGNDGGVWSRPISAHTRGHWTNRNKTLDTLQYYSAAVGNVPGGKAYWGGMQDNGETYYRTGMSRVEQAFTGDGGDTIVDPNNGQRAVEEYVYLDMYMTTDGARTLTEISPSCLTATSPPDPCDPDPRFIAPIEQDVHNPNHWVSGGQYVWEDHKGWNTQCAGPVCDWKKVYDTGDGHQVTALADDGHTMWAAWCGPCNPDTGVPFGRGLATNYGGSWHELSLRGLPKRYITSIAADPANPAHVYVSFGSYSRRWIPDAGVGHVFETTNGGRTWRDDSGNLPDAPVYKVAIRRGQLVVGSEVGAFISSRSHPGQLVDAGPRPAAGHRLGSGGVAGQEQRGARHPRPRPVGARAPIGR